MAGEGGAMTGAGVANAADGRVGLKRALGLWHAVLFGLGVTIGAGIYVLIGATAGRAGMHAPLAFVIAAIVMAPTAASFAELSVRMPVSAGEAAYVKAGFNSETLSLLVGLLVFAVAVISSAAISRGASGYIGELVDIPRPLIVPLVVLAMGAVAAWGIRESVTMAGVMTLIEITGLLVIVVVGAWKAPDLTARIPEIWTGLSAPGVTGAVLGAALLAFFAFIGFEGLANIAEEVRAPERTLPIAIFITLAAATLLYIMVVWVALIAVSRAELAASPAPLSLVFTRVTGASPTLISAIAVVATVNGIIVQMVMASRVLYGMADRGLLPRGLARVHPATATPLVATGLVVATVMVLAVLFPLERLAEITSYLTLVIFAFVNAALVALKLGPKGREPAPFTVPLMVPAVGTLLCVGLLLADLLR